MAEEEIENLPPKEGEGEGKPEKKSSGGGGSPWIPVAVLIVMVPVLSYVLTNFMLVPKIKHSIEEVVGELQINKKEGEHGEGDEHGENSAQVFTYDFENIIANLSGSLHSRYVKISFTVEGTALDFVERVEMSKAKLIDASLGVLSKIELMELEKPEARNLLRNDLLAAFEVAMNSELIQHLYFSEFVVQ